MSGPFGSSQFMYKTGEEEGQSLRFENGDNAYLNWTPPSVGSSLTQTLSFWMKRTNEGNYIFRASEFYLYLAGDNLNYYDYRQGANGLILKTNAVYRDVSAWMHVVLTQDRGNATASNRIKLYVNGEQVTSFSTATYPNQNEGSYFNNSGNIHYMGGTSGNFFDGYLANVAFIDGTALDPTSFGEYKDTLWKPKSDTDIQALTFGTNGFYLAFEDSSAIGDDTSGNANDWTANNLVATDVVLDSPVTGGNFAVMNPVDESGFTFAEGNLKATSPTGNGGSRATIAMESGKWYWEVLYSSKDTGSDVALIGILATDSVVNTATFTDAYGYVYYALDGTKYNNGSGAAYGASYTEGDIIGVTFDADNGDLTFYKNGSSQGTAFTGLTSKVYAPVLSDGSSATAITYIANFGQDSSFAGTKTPQGNTDDNGQGDFYYAPPSGFLALKTSNLPTPTITAPDEYFNTVLYSGNNTQLSVTAVNFQPDWTWIKKRNDIASHVLQDSVRGTYRYLVSNAASAENTNSANDWFRSFDSDGFTVSKTTTGGTPTTEWNNSGDSYVAWNWLADTAFSNSAGTNGADLASTGRVNQDAGFSIVSFDLQATGSKTVAHGLSSAPEMIIVKSRDAATLWPVYTEPTGNTTYLVLDDYAGATTNSTVWDNTSPTSSVFTLGSGFTTTNYDTKQIAYCFHSVEGYSKIGSYTGSASLPFVHCGFRPKFILSKSSSAGGVGYSWNMTDTSRFNINPAEDLVWADSSTAESTANNLDVDILSNGFKLRHTSNTANAAGVTYIFLAFAEAPFKSANAR